MEPDKPASDAVYRCASLRTKAMYVHAQAPSAFDEEQDEPVCWCNRTLRELGPDGEPAEPTPCSDVARECYQWPPGVARPG